MDTHLFWTILVVGVYCVYTVENIGNKLVKPNRQMTKEKAEETCAKMGTAMANYASVKANPTASVYLSQLVEGESAWIKGFAKLSPFLSWYGCFNLTHTRHVTFIHTSAIENRSLYLCSQLCSRSKETVHIGIIKKSCYCINYNQGQVIHPAAVTDSLCSLSCENNVVDSCGGHSFLSVYSVIKPGSMHWARSEPSKRQCVYAKKHTTGFKLYTASCNTLQSVHVNGYICMNSVSSGSVLTSTCLPSDAAGAFCVVDIQSSRQEAYASCTERQGKLADLSSEPTAWPKMIANFKYWISVYRTFGISERYIANKTICLAAVRVNNTLYLEPDDCSEQKHYLCEHKTITHSNQIPNTKSKTSPVIVPTTTLSISITTKPQDSGYVSPFAYIIPSILIVVFLVIIIVVFVLYRRRKKHIKQHDCISDDTYTAIYETDNLENGQSGSVLSSMQGQNEDSNCLISKSKPNKCIKQTQTAKTEESSDKNNKKDKEIQEEDYDKIDFTQPGNVRKDAYEETNVYNHVLDTTGNDYDTTKAVKSFQSVVPSESDDTYSHMKDGVALGDYCGLLVPGKKHGGRDNVPGVNYCFSKDVGQKDSSIDTDKLAQFVIVDDVKNANDIGETTHQAEPVTYTEISKSGAKNETEYSEIQ